MSNIEVGDYVRTKSGVIGKVNYIEKSGQGTRHYNETFEDTIYCIETNENVECYRYKRQGIVNHSKNITDLIEVGDYVNGYRILEIEDINNCNKKAFTIFKKNEHCYVKLWKTEDIKSIVTKEMFLNAEYKVGEQV